MNVDTHVSTVVAALEAGWQAIREVHPDLPPVVIIIGPGDHGKRRKWGHFARERWGAKGKQTIHEILIAGESFTRRAAETFGTLLHEAAHCLAAVRKLKDTSRGGRYHNTVYRDMAGEVGLRCEKDKVFGWTITTITTDTAERYKPQIQALAAAQAVWRIDPPETPSKSKTGTIRLRCACDWSIAVSPAVAEGATIRCDDCGEVFTDRE